MIRRSRMYFLHPATSGISFSVFPSSNPLSRRIINSQLVIVYYNKRISFLAPRLPPRLLWTPGCFPNVLPLQHQKSDTHLGASMMKEYRSLHFQKCNSWSYTKRLHSHSIIHILLTSLLLCSGWLQNSIHSLGSGYLQTPGQIQNCLLLNRTVQRKKRIRSTIY